MVVGVVSDGGRIMQMRGRREGKVRSRRGRGGETLWQRHARFNNAVRHDPVKVRRQCGHLRFKGREMGMVERMLRLEH
eukprot:752779-Hanusia_phi.AAC.6